MDFCLYSLKQCLCVCCRVSVGVYDCDLVPFLSVEVVTIKTFAYLFVRLLVIRHLYSPVNDLALNFYFIQVFSLWASLSAVIMLAVEFYIFGSVRIIRHS